MTELQERDIVVVTSDNEKIPRKYWGRLAIIVQKENVIIRKLFRTDYQVIFIDDHSAATFKESDLSFHRR